MADGKCEGGQRHEMEKRSNLRRLTVESRDERMKTGAEEVKNVLTLIRIRRSCWEEAITTLRFLVFAALVCGNHVSILVKREKPNICSVF